jgi:hypothetical protein
MCGIESLGLAILKVRVVQLLWLVAALCSVAGAATASVIRFDADPVGRPVLKPASRDPFLMPARAPVQVPVSAFTPSPPVQAAPIMPSEPLPQLSFMGRMQTPDGRKVVLAQWSGGGTVSLEQGKLLANGYRVERLSGNMVVLLHPQTQAVVQLQLPPAPRFETR